MSQNRNDSIDRAKQIDAECDRFELAWLQGHRITIESILDANSKQLRSALANELIAIEIDLLQRMGDTPNLEEYQQRFPDIALRHSSDLSRKSRNPNHSSGDDATLDSPNRSDRRTEDRSGELIRYIGDYEILDLIARGGMGVVYRARQRTLGRIVALKMIRGGQFADKEDVERFRSEATAAAKLDHPGIVPIYEVGEQQGHHFYSMGYVEGGSLAGRLLEGPLPNGQCAELLCKIADAVHYAHERGVIHRDIKPANILLDQHGSPRVADFGLAKVSKGSSDLTRSGQVLGTPSFMPPEQAASQASAIGPTSDVYSLGALLYAMLTGRPPFQAATPIETLLQVQKQEPVSPRQFNSNISIDLETITLKCLDKSPARRYPSAQALSQELHRYLDGKPILARPVSSAEHLWRWCRRNPLVATLSSVAALLLIALTIGSVWAYVREVGFQTDLKRALQQETVAKNDAIQAKEEELIAKNEANDAARRADDARIEKEKQAAITENEKERAKASEAITRRNLYVSDAARVDALIKESNLVRAKSILERHIPSSPDEEDLRGFDWYYQWRKVNQEKAKYQFKKPVEVICLSRDERTLAVGCEGGRVYLLDIEKQKIEKEYPFYLNEEHWSTLAFVGVDRLIGHGQQGSFKLWDVDKGETIAHKPAYNERLIMSGGPEVSRIPACVSNDGKFMVGCDSACLLAYWSLESLRPKALPFVNDGVHTRKQGQRIAETVFTLNPSSLFLTSVEPKEIAKLDNAGVKNWDEYYLLKAAENATSRYRSVGEFSSVDNFFRTPTLVSHPACSLALSENGKVLVSGNNFGELQVWNVADLSDPTRWTRASPVRTSIGKQPVVDLNILNDNHLLAVCNASSIQVLELSKLNTIESFTRPGFEFTKVHFVDDNRVAIGTSNGLVCLWSINEETASDWLLAGTEAVTDIVLSPARNSIFVSTVDGSIAVFELHNDTTHQAKSRDVPDWYSVDWLANCNRIASVHHRSSNLTVFDPRDPFTATDVALVKAEKYGLNLQSYLDPVVLRERSRSKDIVSLQTKEIAIWKSDTWERLKLIDYTRHVDEQGQVHTLSMNKHPKTTLEYGKGVFSAINSTGAERLGMMIHADLFEDEERVAIVLDGQSLHLFVNDLETGAIEQELRIVGVAPIPGRTRIACLNKNRLFIDGVRFTADPIGPNYSRSLLWDLSTKGVNEVGETSLDYMNSLSGPTRIINRSKECQRIALWDEQSIRLLDTNHMSLVRTFKEVNRFYFVHLDNTGQLSAAIQSPDGFRWSRWDAILQTWCEIFQGQLNRPPMRGNYQWCFDESRSLLYCQCEPGVFQRWNTKAGKLLKDILLPAGSIEQVCVDGAGTTISLLKSESSFPTQLSVSSFTQNSPNRSFGPTYISRQQIGSHALFPLSSGYFLAFGEVFPSYKSRSEMIRFRGSPFSSLGADVLFSEDMSTLVRCQGQTMSLWQMQKGQKLIPPFHFDYLGTKKIGPSETDVANYESKSRKDETTASPSDDLTHSISPDGSLMASRIGSKLLWAKRPFESWASLQTPLTGATEISAFEWSWDNRTLAVGSNMSDIVVHTPSSGDSFALARVQRGPIHDLLWLPDHRTLASASGDGSIVIWDVDHREVRTRIEAHRGAVKSLSFDKNKNTLLSGGADGMIRQWLAPIPKSDDESKFPFMPPVPDAATREVRSEASPYLTRNRELAIWLIERRAKFSVESFGMWTSINRERVKSVEELTISGISIGSNIAIYDDDLGKLTGLPELRSIDLSNSKITPSGLNKLTGLDSLIHLDLSQIDLTGFDFEALRSSSNLRTLKLLQCNLTDDQLLAIIRLFPELRDLEILASPITSSSVSKIDALKYLKQLRLSVCQISDESLPAIGNLGKLEILDLTNTRLSGLHLEQLATLKSLHRLRLASVPVRDDWLNELPTGSQLNFIDLRNTAITADTAREFMSKRKGVNLHLSSRLFGEHPEIEALLELGPLKGIVHVDGMPHTALGAVDQLQRGGSITGISWPVDRDRSLEDINVLARLPKLERIRVDLNAIPSIHFPILKQIKSLRELELGSPPYHSSSDFKPIGDIQSLQRLTLKYLSDKQNLAQIKRLKNLESLNYMHGFEIDVVAKELPYLRNLGCAKIKVPSLKRALPFLQSLETLTMLEAPEKGLGPIIAQQLALLPKLTRVNVPSSIPEDEIKKIREALPKVEIVKSASTSMSN